VRKFSGFRLLKKPFKGQGLVEFAIVLPIFLILMLGIIEFGYFFFIYSTANQAAREAARYGAGAGEVGTTGYLYYQDCAGMREVATRIGRYAAITDDDVEIWYDTGPDTAETGRCDGTTYSDTVSLGERVVVKVTVNYHSIISLLNIPNVEIRATSARTIVSRVQISSILRTSSVDEALQ
jgi:Flp pilus assembly protein TadG